MNCLISEIGVRCDFQRIQGPAFLSQPIVELTQQFE